MLKAAVNFIVRFIVFMSYLVEFTRDILFK